MELIIDKVLILNRIKSHYKFKSDAEFARFLGIAPNTLSNWYARNSIDFTILFTRCGELDTNWILYGEEAVSPQYRLSDGFSIANDMLEKYSKSPFLEEHKKDIEILLRIIGFQEKTIKAQEKTISTLEKLGSTFS